METDRRDDLDNQEQIEGLDSEGRSWGDYPLDEMLIRSDNRTIHDVVRRIDQGRYVMDPDFQRDFIWPEDKQSKLIESVNHAHSPAGFLSRRGRRGAGSDRGRFATLVHRSTDLSRTS